MSADDWYECPFCMENERKVREEKYVKIPYKEFKELLEEVEVKHPDYEDQSETIRCDYEQWLDEKGNCDSKAACTASSAVANGTPT
ncbi:MAG: hypothetical protein HY820_45080 [Acidobacteria bacterium]|nr:hypothetical protein [Acidobacteriota bacterium]